MLPIVIRLGSRYTPRLTRWRGRSAARRKKRSAFLWLCQHVYLECSTAMTVSPPRTLSPTFTEMVASAGMNTSMRDPNFMIPQPIAGVHAGAFLEPAHDAPRQDADDLTRHDRLALVVDPDLAALVDRCRFGAVRRKEASSGQHHSRDAPGRGHAVHVHVHRRQEDADLTPASWRNPGRRGLRHRLAGHEHFPVRRRQHVVVGRGGRDMPVRIPEEEREEQREQDRGHSEQPPADRAGQHGQRQRDADEGETRGIDAQDEGGGARRLTGRCASAGCAAECESPQPTCGCEGASG